MNFDTTISKPSPTSMKSRLLFVTLIVALIFSIPELSLAQSSEAKKHTVEVRETLFSISRKYNITVQNIRDWNNLESDVIPPGTVLFVSKPATATTRPAQREATQERPAQQETRPAQPPTPRPEVPQPSKPNTERKVTEIIHVVDRGETLFSLARLYNISVSDLRSWNNLSGDALSLNQRLVVGYDTTYTSVIVIDAGVFNERAELEETPAPPAPVEIPASERLRVDEENTTAEFYTVRAGDTLSSISRRFGVTLSDLRRWNEVRGDVITVGQELVVGRTVGTRALTGLTVESTAQGRFYEYEVKRNDSIFRILLNHQMDEVDFRALNSGLSPSDVRPGSKVMLLAPPTVSHSNPYLLRTPAQATVTGTVSEDGLTPVTRYSSSEIAQTTTGGDLYNPDHLTAAHQSLRLGTVVHITNPENQKGVFVLINDRVTNSSIKLSNKAFEVLGLANSSEPRVLINTSVN
jgi:LysM repeat protein